MKTITTAEYKESLKEAIMTNYSMNKATPLAATYETLKADITISTTLQQDEKDVNLQKLQRAYDETRDDLFGKIED